MNEKHLIKELSKEFRELTTKMQRDSQSNSKVINHLSQIINSAKKKYQNAIKNMNKLKNKNERKNWKKSFKNTNFIKT